MERAESLAKTPMEQAHTKAAASVVRRILETNPVFNPNHTATGHWNFFSKGFVRKKKDTVSISQNSRWSFEWKNIGSMGYAEVPILYNESMLFLQDATKCIWSENGVLSFPVSNTFMTCRFKRKIICEDCGPLQTKADPLKIALKTPGELVE